MNFWLKHPSNLNGDGAIKNGGVPKVKRKLGDGSFMGAFTINENFLYFVDYDSEQLRRYDLLLKSEDKLVSLEGAIECANSMLLGDGFVFTGAHFFNDDLSLHWSVLDSLHEMEQAGVEVFQYAMSEVTNVGYGNGKFYRVYDKARPELGLLEIDPIIKSMKHIDICSENFILSDSGYIVSQFGRKLSGFNLDGSLLWEYEFEFRGGIS